MAKSKKPVAIEWKSQSQFYATVKRKGTLLYVGVAPLPEGMWAVMALETVVTRKKGLNAAREIFDNHGHDVVGQYHDISMAFAVAGSYLRSWLSGARPDISVCECAAISATASHSSSNEKPPKALRLTKKEIASAMRAAAN